MRSACAARIRPLIANHFGFRVKVDMTEDDLQHNTTLVKSLRETSNFAHNVSIRSFSFCRTINSVFPIIHTRHFAFHTTAYVLRLFRVNRIYLRTLTLPFHFLIYVIIDHRPRPNSTLSKPYLARGSRCRLFP